MWPRRPGCEIRSRRDLQIFIAIGVWASAMPVLLRLFRLPALLRLMTPPGRDTGASRRDVELALRYTDGVLTHHPLAVRTCLVRSLVLYRVLRGMGVAVSIHFGVTPIGRTLAGHSWLTQRRWPGLSLGGEADRFTAVYTFPPVSEEPGSGSVPCVLPT